MPKKRKSQINKLFNLRHKIDSTKIWYIIYNEGSDKSTPKKNTYNPEISEKIKEARKKGEIYKIKTNRGFISNSPEIAKKVVSDRLEFIGNPKNVSILFFFSDRRLKRRPSPLDEYFLIDRNNIIQSMLIEGFKNQKLIVIYPDGNYYVTDDRYVFKKSKLFRTKSFLKEKKKFLKKYKKLNL